MARNAELVFWANLPAGLLALAIVPHLLFLTLQAAWRLVRGRLRPFLLGKYDAIRAWPEIKTRRRLRGELAHKALSPPHFKLGVGSLEDVRNHIRRPANRPSRRDTATDADAFDRAATRRSGN